VLGLALEGQRCVGVEIERRGKVARVRAERETVLSLGSFGSPQALLLSGIGPTDELRALGIAVALDLPGVGRNLADHPNMPVQFACRDPALSFARYQRLDARSAWGSGGSRRAAGPEPRPSGAPACSTASKAPRRPTCRSSSRRWW
jgi:choline dehydrogenase-like flavoprotein